ncbi:hypothetical protein ACE6H2_006487 [Prunus campanulata]
MKTPKINPKIDSCRFLKFNSYVGLLFCPFTLSINQLNLHQQASQTFFFFFNNGEVHQALLLAFLIVQFSIVSSSSPPQALLTPLPQLATDSPSPKTPSLISLPPSSLGAPMNPPSFFTSDATAIISVSISVGQRHAYSSFSNAVESERCQPQQP